MSSSVPAKTHPRRPRFQDSSPELLPAGIPAQRTAGLEPAEFSYQPHMADPSPDRGAMIAIIGMAVLIVVYLAVFLVLALNVWS